MRLYSMGLQPLSPWLTPWQSDTLAGLLCWQCARSEGPATLEREVLAPARAGSPPFVLSDAFPADLLPLPLAVRLHPWPAEARKLVKQARWITTAAFQRLQAGGPLRLDDLTVAQPLLSGMQLRNRIGRASSTMGGGGLFPTEATVLADPAATLRIYVRLTDGYEERFMRWLEAISATGFGADASVGHGQFALVSGLESADGLDHVVDADGVTILSTFQPGALDPADGCWETFTKYGKLGPDFGLENVFKRPLVLLRPGACFCVRPVPRFLGRTIPMGELLPVAVCQTLRNLGADLIHFAFGLALPMVLGTSF